MRNRKIGREMTRRFDTVRLLAMALVAVVLVGVVTPVCAMPDCDDTSAGTCSDFLPACDDCPDVPVMKHTPDDATSPVALDLSDPAVVATVLPAAAPVLLSLAVTVPATTASPPPLDPLGVRLTV
jgi:hypothetical protein